MPKKWPLAFLFTIVHQTHAQHVFATHWVLFSFWDWFFRAFGAKSGFSDRNSPELAHTIPGKFFPYPLNFGQSVSGFRGFMWASHLSGIDHLQGSHQVRFKCLSTPMRGPNNKPLAFVVHGAHSHELGWAFLSAAALVRLTVTEWLSGSLSLIGRSFCSKAVHIGEHPRQCESGACEHYRSSSEKVSCSHWLTHNIVTTQ